MQTQTIPVIDISPFRQGTAAQQVQVAQAVDHACRQIGFLVITGHGISPELIKRMRRISYQFFALPPTVKLQYKMPPDRYRGYTPLGSEALSYSLDKVSLPDLKESFSIGPVDVPEDEYHRGPQAGNFFASNRWPTEIPAMEAIWSEYYRAMQDLAGELMQIFAVGLGLEPSFFDDKIDRHITNFSVIRYPVQTETPRLGQLRAGAHSDYGSLTIVHRDQAPGGLQVYTQAGDWIDVPYVPDSFVINLGDLMSEWTNDRWRSTLHRVMNPPVEKAEASERMSMLFFHQPNYDAVIRVLDTCCGPEDPPKYGQTTSGEHVMMKIRKHRTVDRQSVATV